MAGALTPKQEAFVREYLIDLNATQAAIRAGYSEKTAGQIGDENLKKLEIAAAVQKAMDARAERTEITADYVLTTIHETIERCKQAQPVLDRKGEPVLVETPGGDLAPAYTFDSNAVLRGAELLGKHLKLFTEKHEHTGKNGGPIQHEQLNHDANAFTSGIIGLASRIRTDRETERTQH